ncbi:DUF4230 domain-containing protein [Sphingomonas sp. RP10(2022)]|uniref:DUF4230 domain-containing protein n=1 Tax=Sphingomonas liriopis TaxID=2949094 RepID=A0A9X2HRG5_9SPHN|nr:DUF4230 domain-containing protein [Sphingomonas liriopis]
MRASAPVLIVSHLAVAGGVYALTDRRPIDTEVRHTGFFTVETTKVLATTVESLRDENRLLVFSYTGNARVSAERTRFWLLSGTQELNVPAVVNYYLDLSDFTLADVSYNDAAKVVAVRLPAVTLGDIAFQPENASTVNGGVLTFGEDTVEALRRLNYKSARRAMVAQAQQPGLLNEARRRARENVQSYFEIPLRIAGRPDVKVVATFR